MFVHIRNKAVGEALNDISYIDTIVDISKNIKWEMICCVLKCLFLDM